MASEAFDNPQEEVFGRMFNKDGGYCISLDRYGRKIVKIEPGSVKHTNASKLDVNIYIAPNNLDIPSPIKDVDIKHCVEEFANTFRLTKVQALFLVTYLINNFIQDTPNMLALLIGPEGSGKTVLAKFLISSINPCQNIINSISEKRDIVAYAKTNCILGFDNVSKLSPKAQDLLCMILTGGSVSERRLHSNNEMEYVELNASIIMFAISLELKPDLAERTILIDLTNAKGSKERLSTLNKKLDQLRNKFFSALIQLFANVLEELPSIKIENLTRMGDYETLGAAVGKCLGYKKPFSDIYKANLRKSASDAVDAQPAILLVMKIVKMNNNEFQGTYAALLNNVRSINYPKEPLPSSEKAFSELLRRHERALNKLGYIIDRPGRIDAGQLVHITYSGE